MKILVACEESGRVTEAFRKKGHAAFSCDLKPTTGTHPEWHIIGNALDYLNPTKFMPPDEFRFTFGIPFATEDGKYKEIRGNWDMLIAFPPCTYLTNAQSVRLYNNEERRKKSEEAKKFFLALWECNIERICIENPVPNKSIGLPEYSQIIQPFNFGANYKKRTCLWLKNLPPLIETCQGKEKDFESWTMKTRSAAIRSKTFQEIANAMAQQWDF